MRAVFFLLCVMSAITLHAAAPATEEWCGTSSNPLPELWQDASLELDALQEIPRAEAWAAAPGRVDALLEDLMTLQLVSVREAPMATEAIGSAHQAVANQRADLLAAAGHRDATAFTRAMSGIQSELDSLKRGLPGSFNPVAFSSAGMFTAKSTVTLHAAAAPLATNRAAEVRVELRDAAGKPVGEDQLLDSHTRKLHALVIDPSLSDYHHEHPVPTGKPGEFAFTFTPHKPGDYLLWLNLVPAATGGTEAPRAVLAGVAPSNAAPSRETRMESVSDGWRQELKLEQNPVRSGQVIAARLRITDERGRPCFDLEPIMGAFAHVVGFMDDRQTILHVHSAGLPPKAGRRSGPDVPFVFAAPKAGQLKLFVQTKIHGQIVLSQFSFPVAE